MIKNNKKEEKMLVEECQYRAVITRLTDDRGYKASVQRRTGLNEWTKIRCGLKGVAFPTKTAAEATAKHKMQIQKSLDAKYLEETSSYVIYDD